MHRAAARSRSTAGRRRRPRHARVHGGGGRRVDGDASHATRTPVPVDGRRHRRHERRRAGISPVRLGRAGDRVRGLRPLLGRQPASVRRLDRSRRCGVPRDHRAHLVVARLGRAVRQPRSDPDASGQRLRDDQPGPHQRHPRRLGRGQGSSRSPASAWASSTTDTRTAQWKGDAGMVHNAPVEVWIKFGLLGLGRLLRDLRDPVPRHLETAKPAAADLRSPVVRRRRVPASGNFVVIGTVYSWPFGASEKGILIFTLIAMAYPPRWRGAPGAAARRAPTTALELTWSETRWRPRSST